MYILSSFECMVSWRYLRARRREGMASLISIISFIGIMVGVAALIVVMAVMNGFREELMTRLLGVNGHIIVQSFDDQIQEYDFLSEKINQIKGIDLAVPIIEGQVLVRSENLGSGGGAVVRSLAEKDLKKIKLISSNIKEGEIENFDNSQGVLIGSRMAKKLGLSIGNKITLISPDGDSTPMGVMPRMKAYSVVGIFEIGMSDYDSSVIYMPFREGQLYFNIQKAAQFLEIYLKDPDKISFMKPKIQKELDVSFFLSDWRERNESFFKASQIERNVMFIILSLIVAVAGLNIVSGLVMLVKEKGHDIAILRTMGATRATILRIFLMTGTIIGISGTLCGLFLGYILCINIESIRKFISWISGTVLFDPDYYILSELPARMDSFDVLSVILMAFILTFFSSFFPAWRASRLDPIEALRYE